MFQILLLQIQIKESQVREVEKLSIKTSLKWLTVAMPVLEKQKLKQLKSIKPENIIKASVVLPSLTWKLHNQQASLLTQMLSS